MAAQFLATHGIDLQAEMDKAQRSDAAILDSSHMSHPNPDPKDSQTFTPSSTSSALHPPDLRHLSLLSNVSLPRTESGTTWDVDVHEGVVTDVRPHDPGRLPRERSNAINGNAALLAPGLCHPHVHVDKAFLFSHPRYAYLRPSRGSFAEAMELTSQAKAEFTEQDLRERAQRVLEESVKAGVTRIRAFVEVDAGVKVKCLEAGMELKQRGEADGVMRVQVCAFAQLPLFSPSEGDEEGGVIRGLMQDAAQREEVEALGSTPYVEADRERMKRNVEWMVDSSIRDRKHLDFHLDYNLDPETEPLVWHVVKTLKDKRWNEYNPSRTIILGHCTRLTLFSPPDWRRLKEEISDLPLYFVGLPTSDLFMMRTPSSTRGTLDIPGLIQEYGLDACIGMNNIGNAFTPYGICDPLALAWMGVGVYSAGTEEVAERLFECVSLRARGAIGLGRVSTAGNGKDSEGLEGKRLEVKVGDEADFVLFGSEREGWRTRRSVAEAVWLYDSCLGRRGIFKGRLTAEK